VALLTESERKLLERLAAEGKPTRLAFGELESARSLERDGFVFLVGGEPRAIITPKGRHFLAGEQPPKKPEKKPLGFLE
jgi:hypothetical protein